MHRINDYSSLLRHGILPMTLCNHIKISEFEGLVLPRFHVIVEYA